MNEPYSVISTSSITQAVEMQREMARRIGEVVTALDRPGVKIRIEEVMLCSCKDMHTVNVIGHDISEEGENYADS